jgi:DNA topoisomerase I
MSNNLVIVESPAKAKTISRFLGKGFKVLASMGHVMDLPKSQMGIEIDKDFKPSYLVPADKKKIISQLKTELAKADILYIATDEDREGEAIGWHLLHALKVDEKKKKVHRIAFHEITETAIKKALESPRKINQHVVDAQQARRVLDRLVGYELTPLLWKKVMYGLSAGRVQSVAVRLVVEREREIEAFKPEEYWEVKGLFDNKEKEAFEADLQKHKNKKISVTNEKDAKKIEKDLEKASYKIVKVEKKQTKRNPAPPFITSTLQQEASRKLHFSVKKTMSVAQQLYEGLDVGKGEVGLITYMRTDSVNLSDLALKAAKKLIEKDYGKEFALETPRRYKGRKGAQEAHEAIRPVDLDLTPDKVSGFLDKDQQRLYELIWKRTIACQMKEALLDKVAADIEAGDYTFRATGQKIAFPGFMEVYLEGRDPGEEEHKGEKFLPKLEEGDDVDLKKLDVSQHFTSPPPRYTEASLVKKMESEGIGRPSTYAPTISTIMTRGYVEKEDKALKPTDVAGVVTDVLVKNFEEIVDYKFTAEMEEKLDMIEEGKIKWVPMIKEFYGPFHKNLESKEKSLKKEDIVNEESDEVCEKCGAKMVIKLSKRGKFLSCGNYPKCKNAKPLNGKEDAISPQEDEKLKELKEKLKDKKCEKCEGQMEVKTGRYGPFLGCSNYPECKNIVSITVFSGVKCPKCKEGQLVERRTRKGGRVFWGCNKFPKCKTATWDRPVDVCNKCGELRTEDKEGNAVCKTCEGGKK